MPLRRGQRRAVWLPAVATALAATARAGPPVWEELSPQVGNHEADHPSVRYSHTATVVGDRMIVTHGYYYGHDGSGPQWLADTWAFDLGGAGASSWVGGSGWTALVRAGADVPKPHARMSHAAVAVAGKVWLFGGDNGGHRDGSGRGYKSSFLNDLWTLDVEGSGWAAGWQELHPAVTPPPRAHHSAVLMRGGADVVVFGGIHLGDLWSFSVGKVAWTELPQRSAHGDGRVPGKRHGHAAAADGDGAGFYLFGGFRFKDDAGGPGQGRDGPLDDLWRYDLRSGAWTELVATHPTGGRTYASMLLLGGSSLALFAGANCHGSCTCFGDVWTFDVGAARGAGWRALAVEAEPVTRYKQSTVLHNDALYTFGGESYQPYMYHNSVSRLRLGDAASDGSGLSAGTLVAGGSLVAVAVAVTVLVKRRFAASRRPSFKMH